MRVGEDRLVFLPNDIDFRVHQGMEINVIRRVEGAIGARAHVVEGMRDEIGAGIGDDASDARAEHTRRAQRLVLEVEGFTGDAVAIRVERRPVERVNGRAIQAHVDIRAAWHIARKKSVADIPSVEGTTVIGRSTPARSRMHAPIRKCRGIDRTREGDLRMKSNTHAARIVSGSVSLIVNGRAEESERSSPVVVILPAASVAVIVR